MYYVMQMNMKQSKKFINYQNKPAEYENYNWREGKPLSEKPAIMTLSANSKESTIHSDFLLAPFDMLVFSQRFISILDSIGVNNIETYQINLIDKTTNTMRDDYLLINILGLIKCLDIDNSELEKYDEDDAEYDGVYRFNLLEKCIKPLEGFNEPPKLFRLAEFKYHVIAHESLKSICETNNITGVEFIPTVEYV